MTIYSQVPGSLDLSGVIGDDWSMGLDFDIDLTGFTWEAKIQDIAGVNVATIVVSEDSPGAGQISLTLADTVTDLLSEKVYRWHLKQTNSGLERVWIAGFFRWYKKQAGRFGATS